MKRILAFWVLSVFVAISTASETYPQEKTITYQIAGGERYVYAVQEPGSLAGNTPIFIYMHGAAGLEEQGMELFPSLRRLLAEKGWLYVCPREEDFGSLRQELEHRYGKRPLYLSGASAGGAAAFEEASQNPD